MADGGRPAPGLRPGQGRPGLVGGVRGEQLGDDAPHGVRGGTAQQTLCAVAPARHDALSAHRCRGQTGRGLAGVGRLKNSLVAACHRCPPRSRRVALRKHHPQYPAKAPPAPRSRDRGIPPSGAAESPGSRRTTGAVPLPSRGAPLSRRPGAPTPCSTCRSARARGEGRHVSSGVRTAGPARTAAAGRRCTGPVTCAMYGAGDTRDPGATGGVHRGNRHRDPARATARQAPAHASWPPERAATSLGVTRSAGLLRSGDRGRRTHPVGGSRGPRRPLTRVSRAGRPASPGRESASPHLAGRDDAEQAVRECG
jgi:hypothetical protein